MSRKKNTTIHIKVDKETKRALEIRATNLGLTLSEYMLIWGLKGISNNKDRYNYIELERLHRVSN